MTGRTWAALALASTLLTAPTAAADAACPPQSGPWLRVALDGDGFGPPLRARVLEQLAADLAERGITACEAPVDGSPLGDVQVTLARPAALSLDLRDDVTQKRVARTLSLAGVPADARGLSIALAVEELLHASWIEAALAPPPAPAPLPVPTPVPPVVVASNAVETARLPRSPVAFVAVVAAADHATGGLTGIGGDVRLAWGGRATLGVQAGARASPDTASTHGSVRPQELLVGLAGAYALVPRERRWGAELVVRVDAVDVQLSGVAGPGAQASSGAALGAVASGGVGGWMGLGRMWRLVAEGTAGAPLHGVTASDDGQTVTGLTGVTFGVAVGVAAGL